MPSRKPRPPRKPPVWDGPNLGKRSDPAPADAGTDPGEVKAALDQCDRIREKIHDATDRVWLAAGDFFDDVDEQLRGVAETIGRTGRVSRRQQSALDGWEGGVDKWLANPGKEDR